MTSLRLRKVRREEADAGLAMAKLSAAREKLRADLRGALEEQDRDRAVELVAEIRQVDRDYTTAADQRRTARRQLLDANKEPVPQ